MGAPVRPQFLLPHRIIFLVISVYLLFPMSSNIITMHTIIYSESNLFSFHKISFNFILTINIPQFILLRDITVFNGVKINFIIQFSHCNCRSLRIRRNTSKISINF